MTSVDPTPAQMVRFALGTLGVSGAFWTAGALSDISLLTPDLPVSAFMFVAPALGLVTAVGPRRAWKTLRVPFTRGRRKLRQAAVWLPVMPLVVLAAARPTWPGATADALPGTSVSLLSAGFVISAVLEQVGYMWLAARGLAPRWGRLAAGVVTGALWAGVHVIPWLQAGRTFEWVIGQSVFSIVFMCLIVEAYLRQHSLLTAVGLQASSNTMWVALASLGGTYDPVATALGTAGVFLAVRAYAHRSQGR